MFEALYEPLPETEPYLKRIGLPGLKVAHDLETLNKLLYAHVHTVPFENLDAWDAGKIPSLAIRDIYEKVVLHRRGGWCVELNALLDSFLTALGFAVYSVGCRVLTAPFTVPIGHHGVICVLDGKKYYCDVGFGDIAFQSAVPLDGTVTAFGFHIEKEGDWYRLLRGTTPYIAFADLAYEPVDYLFTNYVNSTDQNQIFRNTLYVSLMKGETRFLLFGDTLTEQTGNERKKIAVYKNGAELARLLKDYFGIEYSPAGIGM